MTNIPYLQRTEFVGGVMQSAGCAPGEARTVATRLVSSNLAGHDSHGVLLDDTTIAQLREAAKSVGVSVPAWL